MAEFVKKTVVGYKAAGGQSDPECTHVILTKSEYDKSVWELELAQRKVSDMQREARSQVIRAQDEATRQIRQKVAEANAAIDKSNQAVLKAHGKIEYLQELNENLLRIARERANADRKLKPKKDHTGYVVVSSAEKEYRYKSNRRDYETVMLWETVLQTPYSIDFTEEQAREQTKELTGNEGKSDWLVGRLGINASYNGEYDEMLEKAKWSDEQKAEYNIMLTRKLRANYRTGYWEVIFTHTKPLGLVPADMRAR